MFIHQEYHNWAIYTCSFIEDTYITQQSNLYVYGYDDGPYISAGLTTDPQWQVQILLAANFERLY